MAKRSRLVRAPSRARTLQELIQHITLLPLEIVREIIRLLPVMSPARYLRQAPRLDFRRVTPRVGWDPEVGGGLLHGYGFAWKWHTIGGSFYELLDELLAGNPTGLVFW